MHKARGERCPLLGEGAGVGRGPLQQHLMAQIRLDEQRWQVFEAAPQHSRGHTANPCESGI